MSGLSIDTSGTWSVRQAREVARSLEPELEQRGLLLRTRGQPGGRVAIQVLCRRHECVVDDDAVCPVCRRG